MDFCSASVAALNRQFSILKIVGREPGEIIFEQEREVVEFGGQAAGVVRFCGELAQACRA